MVIRRLARNAAQGLLRQFGYHAVPDALIYDWQRLTVPSPAQMSDPIPPEARTYLTRDNPRLRELQQAYAAVCEPVTNAAVWTADYLRPEDLLYFRADNPYVW